MNYRFGKAFHLLSVIAFVAVFLYNYSAFSSYDVYGIARAEGKGLIGINRETFFYAGVILFILLNLLLLLPAKLIEKQGSPNFKRLFPKGDPAGDQLITLMYGFAGLLNVALALLAVHVYRINAFPGESSGVAWSIYAIPVLLLVWILALAIVMGKKVKSIKTN